MDIKIGFKIVNAMRSFSKWLELKAVRMGVGLSMKSYYRENGHL